MGRIFTTIALILVQIITCQAEDPRAREIFAKAVEAQWTWELDEAIKLYTRVIEIDPSMALAHFNRGAAYRSKNMLDEAVRDFNSAIENDPGLRLAYFGRGKILLEKKEFQKALEDMDKVLEADPENTAAIKIKAKAFLAMKKPADAIESLNKVISISDNDPDPYYSRALAHKQINDFKASENDLLKVVEIQPANSEAWYELGNVAFRTGRKETAIEHYNRALEHDPDHQQAFNNRGWVMGRLGRFDKAIEDFTRALEIEPTFLAALKNRAWANAKAGRLDATLKDYEAILKQEPENREIRVARSKLLMQKGKDKAALKEMEKALGQVSEKNQDPAEFKISAEAAYRAGEFQKAIEFYSKAINLDKNNPDLLMARSEVYIKTKNYEQAVKDLRNALQYVKKDKESKVRYELGKAYLINWKLKQAIEQFDKTLELTPDNGLAYANRGVAHKEIGHLKKSEKDLEKALELLVQKDRRQKVKTLLKEVQKTLLGPFEFLRPRDKDREQDKEGPVFQEKLW